MRALGRVTALALLLAVVALPATAKAQTQPNGSTPKSWTMAAEVLAHLEATKDYRELLALYERKAAADSNWRQSAEGRAVDAQLKKWRSDAAATVIIDTNEGRILRYSIGGVTVRDGGTAVTDLERSLPYRQTIAEAIAQNIVTSSLDPKVQAALASFRNVSEASSGNVPAANPGFYLLYMADNSDVAVALDPATVQSLSNGHRRAHFAFVNAFNLWTDNGVEFDCKGHWRSFYSVTHLSSGASIDKIANGTETETNWQPVGSNLVWKLLQDDICHWSNFVSTKSPTKNIPDFMTFIRAISGHIKK